MDRSDIQPKAYYAELDLLRLLAALAVVFYHYTFVHTISVSEASSFPILGELFKYGYLGVEMFFMISGFVILMTAINKSPLDFIVSRVSRLYPVFWIALSITTLSLLFFVTDGSKEITLNKFLINLSMVSEYVDVGNIDPVYWTLQVEIKFYFWIFVIVLLKKLTNIESFLGAWLFISTLDFFHLTHDITRLIFIPEWAPFFCGGALFFIIKTQGMNVKRSLLLVFAYLLSVHYAIEEATLKAGLFNSDFSPIVVAVLITALYIIFILAIGQKVIHLKSRNLMILGGVSYPLYLLHNVLNEIIVSHFARDFNKYILLISVVALMLLVSFIISYFIEPKIISLMKSSLLKHANLVTQFRKLVFQRLKTNTLKKKL